jgi:hypothetical protein
MNICIYIVFIKKTYKLKRQPREAFTKVVSVSGPGPACHYFLRDMREGVVIGHNLGVSSKT